MKPIHIPFALLTFILACSSKSSPGAAPGSGDTDAGDTGDAGVADAAYVPTPYEQAVLSATWTEIAAGPKVLGGAKQDDIFFASAMVGYAASGPSSAIYKTPDGGMTWNKIFTKTGTYFRSVLFTDEMHGFAGNLGAGLDGSITDTNILYETKDGAMTWNPVTTITGPMPSGICNMSAADPQHLFAVGRANGPAHMLASADGGATWTSTDLAAQLSMAIDVRFTTPTDGLIFGMGAGTSSVCTVIHTKDGGKTFDTVFASKTPSSLCWKVDFPSSTVGYVAVQDAGNGPPTFGKTTDGGLTWTESPLPDGGAPKKGYAAIGIGFATENVGWVAAEDPGSKVYRTSDGGLTWTVETGLKAPINRFRFLDKKTAYAIGACTWKLAVDYSGNCYELSGGPPLRIRGDRHRDLRVVCRWLSLDE
jgi:photosystem II stability/assembly factor-like uncharacterized protein